MKRKITLTEGEVYHIYNRSIAHYQIFNDDFDYQRMLYLIKYFLLKNPPIKFANFLNLSQVQQNGFFNHLDYISKNEPKNAQIIAYCLMPTHIHLVLKQLEPNGISNSMSNILNSYSRYFNVKHKRKGPLWESKFQNRLVESDEQLLHLTRYLHLNPVVADLINNPIDWQYSSYNEYLDKNITHPFCEINDLLDINPEQYKSFVNDQIAYQKELSIIKKLTPQLTPLGCQLVKQYFILEICGVKCGNKR